MNRIFQKIKNITITVSIYIYSLLLFVIDNRQHFRLNSDIHNINTRNTLDFHYPQACLSVYQKGAHYTRIRLFNRLPGSIRQLFQDPKQFQMILKGILYVHFFNSMDKYFRYKMD
jgi:hypothetical protein